MKPKTLEFCGINSFSEYARIDFTALTEYGIFGIFGDTGSGKSTVLDCISFALYGDVARSKGSLAEIVNYRLEKAYVHFEFEIYYEGLRRTFRAEREIKRKNAVQSVRVYERKGETLAALSEGVRESNALLLRIVGLEQRDFEKCIALPQGEFAQFVKSARSERLKLVSRLFNLEKYGEGLVKRVNAKFAALREQSQVLKARLEQYDGVTKAFCNALREEIARLEGEEKALSKALEEDRARERAIALGYEKSTERARLLVRMEELEARKSAMKELDSAVMRLEKATAALSMEKEYEETKRKALSDHETLERARARCAATEQECVALTEYDAAKTDAQIERLAALCAESKSADFARKEYEACAQRLAQIDKEQARESEQLCSFSYEEELARIENALQTLGYDGDFMTYAETHGKAALLRAEYAVFADELRGLTQKHEEIAPDSEPLVQKYDALSSAGDQIDYTALRRQYEENGRERERLQTERLKLETRKSRCDVSREKIRALSEEFTKTKARMEQLKAQFEGKESGERAAEQLRKTRLYKTDCETRLAAANENKTKAEIAFTAAVERNNASQSALESALRRLRDALAAGEWESAAEARQLLRDYGDAEAAKKRVEEYKERYAAVRARLRELNKEQFETVTEGDVKAAAERLSDRERARKELSEKAAVARSTLLRSEEQLEKKHALETEYGGVQKDFACYERLKKLLEGNKFMEFVAEEYLQTVALNASKRLLSLTGGRYFLRYDGGFFVGDNFDGGNLRTVSTLSGGETFLVSLSLAIALSAEICARSLRPNEFFFLDEGFGTLDEKLVDVVMDSLEKLKNENLTVGIISHVEELKHRISRKLSVKKATEKHGSQILTE